MDRPIPKKWLEPSRFSAEIGASDYETVLLRACPGGLSLNNRLNRLCSSKSYSPATANRDRA